MATYTKFNSFVEALAEKQHNLGSDTIEVAFCTAANAPVAANAQLTDLIVIDSSNFDSKIITVSASSQTGGTYTMVCTDKVMTATGGAIPTFRYVVIFNQTSLNDLLICFLDYGSDVTLAQNETFTLDFGAQLLSLA